MPFDLGLHDALHWISAHDTSFLHGTEHDAPPSSAHEAHFSDDVPKVDSEVEKLGRGVVKVNLLNNFNNQYYGDFTLGEPKQKFTAIFDTGSAPTWVPSTKCTDETCMLHNRFDPASSSQFQVPGKDARLDMHIGYGTGSVDTRVGTDTLSFCDSRDNPGCSGAEGHRLDLHGTNFGMSYKQSSWPFSSLPFDGIVGLAPSINKGSIMQHIRDAHLLPKSLFGIYLSQDHHRNGDIDFGGVDPSHVAKGAKLHWHPQTQDRVWQLDMKDIWVDGKPLHLCDNRENGVCPAVVDTGSSLITGPQDQIQPLLDATTAKDVCDVDPSKLPVVEIQLKDEDGNLVSYPLKGNEYRYRYVDEESAEPAKERGFLSSLKDISKSHSAGVRYVCGPAFGGLDVPGRRWVLGDSFLRRYYSIFDDDHHRVGFVRSIHPEEQSTPTGHSAEPVVQSKESRSGLTAEPSLHQAAVGPALLLFSLEAKRRELRQRQFRDYL